MEEFRELVLLLKNYSADQHIEVFDSISIKQSPFWVEGVFENGYADADHQMAPTPGMNGHSKATCHDPSQSRQRLWNTLLFLDLTQEDHHDPRRVAYLCWQRLAVLKTLMAAGAFKSLREIAESILQMATAYELTTIVIETAAQLRQFCALHDGNMSGFKKYCQLIDQYENILQAEQAADDEYCAFLFLQNQASCSAQSLSQHAKEACQRLQPYADSCTTSAFVLNFYFLKLQAAFLEAEWEKVVQISNQATQLLSRKSVSSPAKIGAFSLSKALGWANLGQLDQALEALNAAIADEIEGNLNWYRLQEMKLTWLLHQSKYAAALDLAKTLNLKNKYPEWPQEQKRLYNSVLLSLADLGILSIPNRVKGMLMANCLPFRNLHLPEMSSANLDAKAALLLLQLPKWIQSGASGQVANWFQQYLEWSGACAPQSRRLETLVTTLQDIEAGQKPAQAALECITQLKNLPLDYSSPEAAPEIIKIEQIMDTLIRL
ncbi:hypothetical protein [Haliscomenobacter sp.]|uniref:hypothetical protein n=1 Tax=Haliscomenobacter sp. TaxID=2717303 RepID=UPI003593293E